MNEAIEQAVRAEVPDELILIAARLRRADAVVRRLLGASGRAFHAGWRLTPEREIPDHEQPGWNAGYRAGYEEGRLSGFRQIASDPSAHVCENCPTCGVHGGMQIKCCGCYDGVCCQTTDWEYGEQSEAPCTSTG